MNKYNTKYTTIVAALFLSACNAGSGGQNLAKIIDDTPVVDDSGVAPDDNSIEITYYTLAKTSAPVNGWPTKQITVTANCLEYQSQTYCWDDGIKSLSWSDFSGNHYGPYTYTYFGVQGTPSSWNQCSGSCSSSLVTTPTFVSIALRSAITISTTNEVLNSGTAHTATCTDNNGVIDCGDFILDTTQQSI